MQLFLFITVFGCNEDKSVSIKIKNNTTNFDSLFIHELVTEKLIVGISLKDTSTVHRFTVDDATLCVMSIKGMNTTPLTIISHGDSKVVSVDSIGMNTVNSIGDSLVNFLWYSQNEMFSTYSALLFEKNDPNKVRAVFDSLISARAQIIKDQYPELNREEIKILEYQNKARAYNFLMYYGRIIQNYPPNSPFFEFLGNIDNKNTYVKTLPDVVLYGYEIGFLQKNDSIPDIESFLRHIEEKTLDQDLCSFLKIIYLKEVIENPSYWRKHRQLFTPPSITKALSREKSNKYIQLISKTTDSFFSSQKGEVAFDFAASTTDGSKIKLSDFAEKLVVIDVWATWCSPCISQRPGMINLAEKYHHNPDVAIIMLSVDASEERWKEYVHRTNSKNFGLELNIPDGMNEEFGHKYSIKSIPRYIIINGHGKIVNANSPEPSLALEQLIENELMKL